MNFEVKYTSDFKQSLKKITKKQRSIHDDLLILIEQLEVQPQLGVQIRPNLYKIRLNISGSNKGKSGGARVITYVILIKEIVFLAEIYLKSEFETIDEDLLIKRLIAQGYI